MARSDRAGWTWGTARIPRGRPGGAGAPRLSGRYRVHARRGTGAMPSRAAAASFAPGRPAGTITAASRSAPLPMPEIDESVHVRPLDELDIDAITGIDETIGGRYRPEVWETRTGYY